MTQASDAASPALRAHPKNTPRRRTLLWQRLVLFALRGATGFLQALPRSSALRWGTRLGHLAFRVTARKRNIALSNLRLAYGEALSQTERTDLTRRVFAHYGRCLVDFVRAPALSPVQLDGLIQADGWNYVREAKAKNKGVLLITAHLGNWELLGRWVAAQGMPLTAVAVEPKNPALAAYLQTMRENAGFSVLPKGSSARDLLRVLKKGEVVILLSDQNSGDVFVPFFGVPCGTVAGPASLALHTGAALIPTYCLQQPDGTFRVECFPPLDTTPTGNRDADVHRITTQMNQTLEGVVRAHPDQWLWLHNRWKSAFDEWNRDRAWPCDAANPAPRAAALQRRSGHD